MNFTADFHARQLDGRLHDAIALLRDVDAPMRKFCAEHNYDEPMPHYTIGYLRATLAGLIDACGYPQQGPNLPDE